MSDANIMQAFYHQEKRVFFPFTGYVRTRLEILCNQDMVHLHAELVLLSFVNNATFYYKLQSKTNRSCYRYSFVMFYHDV